MLPQSSNVPTISSIIRKIVLSIGSPAVFDSETFGVIHCICTTEDRYIISIDDNTPLFEAYGLCSIMHRRYDKLMALASEVIYASREDIEKKLIKIDLLS